jgi:hypothetical protein
LHFASARTIDRFRVGVSFFIFCQHRRPVRPERLAKSTILSSRLCSGVTETIENPSTAPSCRVEDGRDVAERHRVRQPADLEELATGLFGRPPQPGPSAREREENRGEQ